MPGTPVPHGSRDSGLLAGYFLFGEESYLAEEFLAELKAKLTAESGGEPPLERFSLGETRWPVILDAARTAPFLFELWRAIVVRVPEPSSSSGRAGGRGEEGPGTKLLSATDQKLLKAYFESPPARTVLVIIQSGRVRKDGPFVRFFSSLPKAAVAVMEMKPLSPGPLMKRAEDRARALGKTLTEGAKRRLLEILGQDLRLVLKEVEKLAVFVGERKGIEEDDVDQATAWQRSFKTYELDDALLAADFTAGAAILRTLFAEGETPELVLGRLTGFFRNVLTAQTWLKERRRTREEIFSALYPKVPRGYGDIWGQKFRWFFAAVEGLSPSELDGLLAKLRAIDLRLKTEATGGIETALETFFQEYAQFRGKGGAISGRRG